MRKTAEQNKKNERAAVYRPPGVGCGITTRPRNWHMFRIQTKGATSNGGGGDGKMSGASSPLPLSHKQTQREFTQTLNAADRNRDEETERSLDSGPAASELELKLKRAEVRGRERSPWQTDKRLCAASHRGAWDYANKSARALRRKTGGSREGGWRRGASERSVWQQGERGEGGVRATPAPLGN